MIKKQLNLFVKAKGFGNLYRKQCVLIAVGNKTGNILLGAKPYYYPPGISRLLGGGVDEGESLEEAAARELREELGLSLDKSLFKPLAMFDVYSVDEEDEQHHSQTYVYHVKIDGKQPHKAGGDVKQIIEMSIDDLHQLGELYDKLPETLWYKGKEGEFCWADYGRMYGPIHRVVAELLKS